MEGCVEGWGERYSVRMLGRRSMDLRVCGLAQRKSMSGSSEVGGSGGVFEGWLVVLGDWEWG